LKPAIDRLIWIHSLDEEVDNAKQTFVQFKSNALVFGERVSDPDLVWFLSFGSPIEESPSQELSNRWLAALNQIRRMGLPRELDTGRWQLGS
jgi:hypothetical protein